MSGVKIKNVQRKKHKDKFVVVKVQSIINLTKQVGMDIGAVWVVVSNGGKNIKIQAVGFIDKQILPLDDAWFVEYRYDWNTEKHDRYHLVNKLKGVDQNITREQAQTPEQIAEDHSWLTIDDTQARELAIQLSLAS